MFSLLDLTCPACHSQPCFNLAPSVLASLEREHWSLGGHLCVSVLCTANQKTYPNKSIEDIVQSTEMSSKHCILDSYFLYAQGPFF